MNPVRQRVIRVPLVLCAALACAGSGSLATLAGCSQVEQAPAVAFTLLDGRRSDLAALRGRVVLVNFWATECAPCVAEMPGLVATWRKFAPQGFETLAVSMSYDPPALVSNFARSHGLPFGVVIDNTGEFAGRFGDIHATPTSVLIDKHGAIVKQWIGTTDFAALQSLIADLVTKS